MKNSRREFIKASGLLAAGLSFPVRAQTPLKILILGGTGFIGPHMVNYAVSRGHQVSIFTRGNRELDIPGVEHLVGDRNNDHTALKVDHGTLFSITMHKITGGYKPVLHY